MYRAADTGCGVNLKTFFFLYYRLYYECILCLCAPHFGTFGKRIRLRAVSRARARRVRSRARDRDEFRKDFPVVIVCGNLTVCGEREDEGQQKRSAEPHLEMFARHPIRSESWSSSDDGSLRMKFASEKPLYTQNVENSHEGIAAADAKHNYRKKSTHHNEYACARAQQSLDKRTREHHSTDCRLAGWRAGASGAAPTVARRGPRFGAYSVATGTV